MILRHVATRLRDLFRAPAPPPVSVAQRAAALEQRVLAFVGNLRPMPDVAARALALARDPDSRFADFVRLVEADPAIAATVLRVANSALFAGGAQTLKLAQAVTRLGMWQCQNLIVAVALRGAFRGSDPGTREVCETLWHHGYVTAALCQQINRGCRLGFQGEEFAAGLLHDLGRLLLALADPESFALVGGLGFAEDPGVVPRERAAIGVDHGLLGGWFAEFSDLPAALAATVRAHHAADLTGPDRRLTALVAAADAAANHYQRGEPVAGFDPAASTEFAALSLGWHPGRRDRLFDAVPDMLAQAAAAAQQANG